MGLSHTSHTTPKRFILQNDTQEPMLQGVSSAGQVGSAYPLWIESRHMPVFPPDDNLDLSFSNLCQDTFFFKKDTGSIILRCRET